MANVKNAAIREIVIDRCLRHPGGRTTQQMMEACNRALDLHGYRLVTSENTIRYDLISIENRWHQVIDSRRKGRQIYYYYRDPDFSIFNNLFSEKEMMKVYGALEVMERFKGHAGFSWIEEVSARLRATLHMGKNTQSYIAYDDNAQLRGMHFFEQLHDYIRAHQAIKVEYQPYKSSEKMKEVVHPYFLKEYNCRWFILGYNEKYDALTTFALDRIISIEKSSSKYIPNKKYDFEQYFKNIIGVTLYPQEPEEILIEVKKTLYPYISSKPMHPSQNLVRLTEEGDAVISLHVIPNYELKQLILSHGDRMIVLSPQYLRDEICNEIKNILKNYQLTQFG